MLHPQTEGSPQFLPVSLTVAGAVAYTGISRTVLFRRISTGEIPSFRIGTRRMIFREALDTFLQRQAEQTQ